MRLRLLSSISISKLSSSLFLIAISLFVFARNRYTELKSAQHLVNNEDIKVKSVISDEGAGEVERFAWSNELSAWTLARYGEESDELPEFESCVWPNECGEGAPRLDDRIINQLKLGNKVEKSFKLLSLDYPSPSDQDAFRDCIADRCRITYDPTEADALIFQNSDVPDEIVKSRQPGQVWIAHLLESPIHTYDPKFPRRNRAKHPFNWTATYRHDSDIVTPYSKFVVFHDKVRDYARLRSGGFDRNSINEFYEQSSGRHKSLIRNKEFKIAWFVSNCHAANSRLEYAKELSKHIQVDIYGRCGNYTCDKQSRSQCLNLVNEKYKFYLSFENSNCVEYITEKLYENAYGYNNPNYLIVPIVMGPSKENYNALAPAASFIHVDDYLSANDLADYLKTIDKDDALYYSYFRWKQLGRFIDTKFKCRVCAMLHEAAASRKVKSYDDMILWWTSEPNGDKACEPR